MSTPLPAITPAPFRSVLRFGEACEVAWIWARAFTGRAAASQTGWRRWLLQLVGTAAVPLYWLLHVQIVGVYGPSVIRLDRAAAIVPNPRTGRRSRPAFRVLVPALMMEVILLAAVVVVLGLLVGIALGLVLAALVAMLLSTVGVVFLSRNSGRELKVQRRALEAAHQEVTVISSFAAWPKRTGHGGRLLTAVLAQLHTTKVRPILHAVDEAARLFYVHYGAKASNAAHQRVLSW